MTLTVDVATEESRWLEALPEAEALAADAVRAALTAAGRLEDDTEISLVLAGDAAVRALNRDWRGQDKPTNVLSFPAGEPLMLGDVVIAFETTAAEALRDGKSLADHFRHLVVHGVLHLIGYDHEDEAEALTMERLEIAVLARLGVGDPYGDLPDGGAEE